MSEGNGDVKDGLGKDGVLRISRKGLQQLQLGEDGKVITVDVMGFISAWAEVDRTFRDEAGKIAPERWPEHQKTLVEFVRAMFKKNGESDEFVEKINHAEALQVMNGLRKCGDELRRFFDPDSGKERSSPASTELIFSG